MEILDSYITSPPSKQNVLDIFKGECASKLPDKFGTLEAGQITLFNDARMNWCSKRVGGIKDKTVLELGLLEAGHTYMLENLGAASIVVVANTRAYFNCLIVQEILDLKRTKFICGNCVEYLRNVAEKFDVCIPSGVL